MLLAPSVWVQTPLAAAQTRPASSPTQPLQLVTQAEMQASLAAGDAPQVPVARVTREGIVVPEATLPSGTHQLQMILTDAVGRETRQTLAFTVQ